MRTYENTTVRPWEGEEEQVFAAHFCQSRVSKAMAVVELKMMVQISHSQQVVGYQPEMMDLKIETFKQKEPLKSHPSPGVPVLLSDEGVSESGDSVPSDWTGLRQVETWHQAIPKS